MIIGTLEKNGEAYFGKVSVQPEVEFSISVKPTEGESENEKAPSHRIYGKGGADLGAAWSKTSQSGNSYLQLKLDWPMLPDAIRANLIEQNGKHVLIWNRD